MDKLLFTIIVALMPLLCISQGMKIKWEDSSGREFSINTHTGNFEYSTITGDNIYYNSAYDSGPKGSVKSIGNTYIHYNSAYDSGPKGSVKSIGNTYIYYNSTYDSGPEGTVKSVGGLEVYYNSAYSGGPEGTIKRTFGSVN